MVRFDQWDWKPLRDLSVSCGIDTPKLSFLGGGRVFDPPHIESPWVEVTSTHASPLETPDPKWLWRYEDGPIDWQKLMGAADQSDIVVTAPAYVGQVFNKEDLDNQHNTEFAERLSHDPLFQKPVHLQMGRFAPVDVLVFVKNALVCRQGNDAHIDGKGL